jgi:hypothetical protein
VKFLNGRKSDISIWWTHECGFTRGKPPAHHRRLSSFATAFAQQPAQPGCNPVARCVATRVSAEFFSAPLIGDRAG